IIMKNLNVFILLGLLITCISCGSDSSEKQNESSEPNDKIDEANSIEPGTEFQMKVHPKEDGDWYKVEIPGQGYLKLVSKNVPDEIDVQVRFATYEEWGEEKENFLTNFLKMPAAVAFEGEDTCYALVADRWNENASETPFTLKFEFIEEFDEHEPNNEVESAKDIELDKAYKSAIFPKGEIDWFKITTNEQGYLHVAYKDKPEDMDVAVAVATYDEFSDEKIEYLKNLDVMPQSVTLTEPGEYYIVVSDRWNENASEKGFTWKPEFIPEMDTCEPNNTFADAKLVACKDTVKLAVFPKEDKDMIKFSPGEPGTLKIKSAKIDDVNVSAGIYKLNDDENELKELHGVDELPITYDVTDTGMDYYIVVQDRWHEDESPETFDVIFEYGEGTTLTAE
ncbi:MAG: hypothetical protein PF590_03655, partial [Candidatus Delongbacteria bacterium]|nr:hypothetical protein [Candidatus Delongbacteria bacterium]